MAEVRVEIADLDPAMRSALAECELTGKRTHFMRGDRTIAITISYDEYQALRETIELGEREPLRRELEEREAEVRRGDLLLPEDLFVE